MTTVIKPTLAAVIGPYAMEDGYPVADEARPALLEALRAAALPIPWRTGDEPAIATQEVAQPNEPAEPPETENLSGAISEDVGANEFINLLEE